VGLFANYATRTSKAEEQEVYAKSKALFLRQLDDAMYFLCSGY
jgi:hypothetical protein